MLINFPPPAQNLCFHTYIERIVMAETDFRVSEVITSVLVLKFPPQPGALETGSLRFPAFRSKRDILG